MVSETNFQSMSQITAVINWEPPLPPTDLIFDDGEPLETNRHRIAMNALIRSLPNALADRDDYFVGGNMFVYYSSAQVRNKDFHGPDFFVVLGVDGRTDRQGWVVWEENRRYPDVLVKFMSSTAEADIGVKKDIYEQIFRTPDYYVFDPFDSNSLRGWHLDANQCYQPLTPNEQGWLWCQRLGLWLGAWSGTIERVGTVWLRFYDSAGNLVPLPEEAAQQGLRQGALRQLLRLLTTRFGTVPTNVEQGLQALDVNQLEELVDVALAVDSLEQFVNHWSGKLSTRQTI